MDIIVCGGGEVGSHAAEVLNRAGHAVTVVDRDPLRLREIEETMDVRTLVGNAAHADTLAAAGAEAADLVLAATNTDEVNLLTASVAKGLGATRTVARVHALTYFEREAFDYAEHLGIDRLMCPEFVTSTAIASHLRNPAALTVEHFARGRIDMQEFPVSEDAPALGRALMDLRLPRGWRLAAVTRRHEVFVPSGDTVVEPDDRVLLVANSDVFQEVRRAFSKEGGGRRRLVVMGGPPMAVWLCRELRERAWSIRLFETNAARADELAEAMDWVTVIRADPTDPAVLEEEQLGLADAFVAMLGDEEANIIGCALAKSLGVTTVMAVVQRSNYLDLLSHIGVDRGFSPRIVAAREIEAALDDRPLRRVATIGGETIDVWQVRMDEKSPVAGRLLTEVKAAPAFAIVAIRRGDAAWVPTANDHLQSGDVVLVAGRHGQEEALRRIFRPR